MTCTFHYRIPWKNTSFRQGNSEGHSSTASSLKLTFYLQHANVGHPWIEYNTQEWISSGIILLWAMKLTDVGPPHRAGTYNSSSCPSLIDCGQWLHRRSGWKRYGHRFQPERRDLHKQFTHGHRICQPHRNLHLLVHGLWTPCRAPCEKQQKSHVITYTPSSLSTRSGLIAYTLTGLSLLNAIITISRRSLNPWAWPSGCTGGI